MARNGNGWSWVLKVAILTNLGFVKSVSPERQDTWNFKKLQHHTHDVQTYVAAGLASEQPYGFDCTLKEHIRHVYSSPLPKCNCQKGNQQCYSRCQKLRMFRQIHLALGGGEFGSLGQPESMLGKWWERPSANPVITVRFKWSQEVTASFDADLNLHGAMKVASISRRDIRFFHHGLEVGPHIIYLSRMVLVKHNSSKRLIMRSNQWLDRESTEEEDDCQPIVLNIPTGNARAWTVKTLASPLFPPPQSLNALLALVKRVISREEEGEGEVVVGFDVPPHLRERMTSTEEVETIVTGVHSANCVNRQYKPPKKFIAIQDLMDRTNGGAKMNSSFWRSEEFSGDPVCAAHNELSVPPVAMLTLSNVICFPGSGSKWVMEMTQFLAGYVTDVTGVWLLKTHHDNNVYLRQALETGSPRPPTRLESRFSVLDWTGGRAVVLLRDPFRAIASWWNHMGSSSFGSRSMEQGRLEASLRSDAFCGFAAQEAVAWRDLALDYLTLSADALFVFYEEVRRDFEAEMKRILRFLKIPIEQEKFECLRRHPMVRHKREKKAADKHPAEFFCRESRLIVEEALRDVQEALKEHMFRDLPSEYFRNKS